MNCILCAASTYTKECALLQFRICRKCRRKTAHYTLFRSKMSKEVAQQTCVSLCPSPDVEKAPLHPFVALFCPSEPPPTSLITQMRKSCPFWSAFNFFGRLFLDGPLFWSVYYLSAPRCFVIEVNQIFTIGRQI